MSSQLTFQPCFSSAASETVAIDFACPSNPQIQEIHDARSTFLACLADGAFEGDHSTRIEAAQRPTGVSVIQPPLHRRAFETTGSVIPTAR